MKTFDLLGFIAEIPAIERDLHATGPMIVEHACQIVERRAKSAIGRDHELWPALAPSTIEDKQQHGYATPKPLLRSGSFRDSIEHTTDGLAGCVGTDDPRGPWFEFGTSRMPARSWLVSSAKTSEDRIHRMAAAATMAALAGHGRHASDVRELLHLLHAAGHSLYELGADLLQDDEDEGSK